MLLISCMICAERDPHDPEFPRLKLVGVYPVIDGWAHINLKELAGKGQDYYSPLYIAPGVVSAITSPGVCGCPMSIFAGIVPQVGKEGCQLKGPRGAGSAIMKRLGLGLERRLESPNIVKAITGTKIPSVSAQRSWNRKGPKHALRDESALETM